MAGPSNIRQSCKGGTDETASVSCRRRAWWRSASPCRSASVRATGRHHSRRSTRPPTTRTSTPSRRKMQRTADRGGQLDPVRGSRRAARTSTGSTTARATTSTSTTPATASTTSGTASSSGPRSATRNRSCTRAAGDVDRRPRPERHPDVLGRAVALQHRPLGHADSKARSSKQVEAPQQAPQAPLPRGTCAASTRSLATFRWRRTTPATRRSRTTSRSRTRRSPTCRAAARSSPGRGRTRSSSIWVQRSTRSTSAPTPEPREGQGRPRRLRRALDRPAGARGEGHQERPGSRTRPTTRTPSSACGPRRSARASRS